jgi:predicted phage terminase large subunit-like protein
VTPDVAQIAARGGVLNLRSMALQIEASLLSESLYEFAKAAWHIVEPGVAFRDNWHLHVICSHLEAVSHGVIRNLIINIPPRSMKSLLVSVLWPAWQWTWKPTHKWLFSSYGQALATRDALKTRRLLQSTWYQERWGALSEWEQRFKLTGDQNQKMRYENDRLGYRISTSVGGLGTGEGGDTVVVDDPHNVEEAESDAVRESTCTWWFETMSTRGNDPERVAKVIVMQRVHEKDLTAQCLERGGYDHLCLPMEYESDHPTLSSTALGFKDPRKDEGALLWPGRFTAKALADLKTSLGEYGTAGQLQQRPTPRGGGMFKKEHLKLWPADKELPGLLFVLQSYDTAFTDKTTNDPCAAISLGVFELNGKRRLLLMDAWSDWLRYSALRRRVVKDWGTRYGGDAKQRVPPRRPDALLVENKSSGISIIQDLHEASIPAQKYNPGDADKTARAERVMPLYEMGVLYVPETKQAKPGARWIETFATWAQPFVTQLTKFAPGVSGHDDYVDTLTQALIFLKDGGWLDSPEGYVDDEEPSAAYGTKRKSNPYGE